MTTNFVTYDLKVIDTFGSSLLAYWPLWELSGTTASDVSGNARNGVYTGVTLAQTGIGDGRTAAYYGGDGDRTNIYSASLAAAFGATEGTLMVWAKANNAGMWTDSTTRRLVYLSADVNNRIIINRDTTANTLSIFYIAGGTNKNRAITISSTAWNCYVITWSKSADEVKVYLNGVQQGATLTGLGTWAGSLLSTTTQIGAQDTSGTNPWFGWLAHVAIGNRALTGAEVAALAVVPFGGATATVTELQTEQARASTYLNVFKPVTLLTANVNNGAITRGARTIAFDGGTGSGFATIAEGQTLEVVTANGTKKTLVKSISGTQASGTIELYENGIVWADNLVIRIKHFYEPHPIPPAIRSGTFYKFYDLAYSDQNSQPKPVVIMGSHRAGSVAAGAISFGLNAASSYAVASGATISSYAWACVHNGGGTTGITIADATAAITTLIITTADQYWLSCTVTDSNGKVSTSYRAIFTDAPYVDFSIQSFSGDWQSGGWRVSLQATGDVELSDFPDGSLAILWYENTFNGVSGYVNLWGVSNEILTCGYLRQDNSQDNWGPPEQGGGTGAVTFQISTIDDLLNNVAELGSVSIGAVASPTKWYEYASWMTTGRSIHHLLLWHSWGVFQCVDVIGLTTNTLGVFNTDFTEGSLLQQANGFAHDRGIFAKLICDRLGRLHLVADSQMLSDAGRAALDTVFTITEADVSGGVDVAREPEETTTFTQLDGFSFNGTTSTPFISIIPGYRENSISYIMPEERGGSPAAVSNQVLADQTDSNVRVGRYHAKENNNPRELRFSNPYSGLGAFDIVPSIGWYEWGIADADLKRNTELNGKQFVCRNINARFNHQAGTILTDVVLEREAIGPPGIQGNYPTGYPAASNNPTEPDWDSDSAGIGVPFGVIWDTNVAGAGNGWIRFAEVGSIDYGTAYEFETVAVDYVSFCGLTDGKALLVYRVLSAADITAKVLTITGKEVTGAGSALTLVTATRDRCSVVKLSATAAIAVWATGTDIYGMAMTISGTTITPGAETLIGTGRASGARPHVVALSATRAMVAFSDAGLIQAAILNISGTTITPVAQADASTNNGTTYTDIAALDSETVIVFYAATDTTLRASLLHSITASAFTIGDDISVDGAAALTSDDLETPHWAAPLDSTRAFAAYSEDFASQLQVKGVAVERSGTTLIPGTAVVLATDLTITFQRRTPAVVALNSSRVVVAFYNEISAGVFEGTALTATISGTTVTDNADDTAFSASVSVALGLHNLGAGTLIG